MLAWSSLLTSVADQISTSSFVQTVSTMVQPYKVHPLQVVVQMVIGQLLSVLPVFVRWDSPI